MLYFSLFIYLFVLQSKHTVSLLWSTIDWHDFVKVNSDLMPEVILLLTLVSPALMWVVYVIFRNLTIFSLNVSPFL